MEYLNGTGILTKPKCAKLVTSDGIDASIHKDLEIGMKMKY